MRKVSQALSPMQKLIRTLRDMERFGKISHQDRVSVQMRAEGYDHRGALGDARGIHHSGLRVGKEMWHSVTQLSRKSRSTKIEEE